MKEFKYIITDSDGIHARPAGELVKAAKAFSCDIKMEKDGKSADLKKIFAVMSLGVKKGHEVLITADGTDEEQAIQTLEAFMKNHL